MTKKKPDSLASRRQLLEDFGLLTEGELAVLFDVEIKTLKNRPANDLPPFTRTGGTKLFFREDIKKFLQDKRSG
jgi:hypothetical protein